jgi:hypothetical protein
MTDAEGRRDAFSVILPSTSRKRQPCSICDDCRHSVGAERRPSVRSLLTAAAAALLVATGTAYADDPAPPPIPPKPLRGTLADPSNIAPGPNIPTAPPPAQSVEACASPTDLLNLRAGPGDTFPIITALPAGAIIAVLPEDAGNWQHVATVFGGGWVFKGYIQPVRCPPRRIP